MAWPPPKFSKKKNLKVRKKKYLKNKKNKGKKENLAYLAPTQKKFSAIGPCP